MAKRHSFWNDPKYDRMLKKLAAQELYASEIAARMTELYGFTITRNSIVGRAYRTRVCLSQPAKLARIRMERAADLQKWLRKPENMAHRTKCAKAGFERWRKSVDC